MPSKSTTGGTEMVGLAPGDYGLLLVDSLRPHYGTNDLSLPSSRQCVGTNRLWGANLGVAGHLDLVTKKPDKQDLINIAVLSRSCLVIEDHVKDEYLSGATATYCNEWLKNITNALEEIYSRVGEDFITHVVLSQRASQAHDKRIWLGRFVNSYRSSIEKCLIFFMPYRLKSFSENCARYEERISFLETYFFCCQLLDDFHDLEEDMKKRTNHNVFLENISRDYWEGLSICKAKLLPDLLLLIKGNLTSADNVRATEGNSILEYYLEASTWWVDQKLSSIGNNPLTPLAESKFENFVFEESTAQALLQDNTRGIRYYPLEDIRPEIFQTAYMGLRHIDEV